MTSRLLPALLVTLVPVLALYGGMSLLDRLAGWQQARRERRAALAPVIRLDARLAAARRDATNDIRAYRRNSR